MTRWIKVYLFSANFQIQSAGIFKQPCLTISGINLKKNESCRSLTWTKLSVLQHRRSLQDSLPFYLPMFLVFPTWLLKQQQERCLVRGKHEFIFNIKLKQEKSVFPAFTFPVMWRTATLFRSRKQSRDAKLAPQSVWHLNKLKRLFHLERLHIYLVRTSVVESAYKWAVDDVISTHIYARLRYATIILTSTISYDSVSSPNTSARL